jgi:NAD(P)-dependent dehydrogenase (short-subunit alcohol dehydrogenase family)
VELDGKTALVTGAAQGIGRVVAGRLAALGAAVVVADRDEPEGRNAVEEIARARERASFVLADVTRTDDVRQMIAAAEAAYGGLDVLVNNAGGYDVPVFPDADLDHWTQTLDLNLRAVMVGIHLAVRSMKGRGGGAIVNVASSAGLGLAPHPSPEYAAAKAAVMRLTACLAPLSDG